MIGWWSHELRLRRITNRDYLRLAAVVTAGVGGCPGARQGVVARTTAINPGLGHLHRYLRLTIVRRSQRGCARHTVTLDGDISRSIAQHRRCRVLHVDYLRL